MDQNRSSIIKIKMFAANRRFIALLVSAVIFFSQAMYFPVYADEVRIDFLNEIPEDIEENSPWSVSEESLETIPEEIQEVIPEDEQKDQPEEKRAGLQTASLEDKGESGEETREYMPGEAIICIQPSVTSERNIALRSTGTFSTASAIESDFLMDVTDAVKDLSEEGEGSGNFSIQSAGDGISSVVLKSVRSDSLSTEELIEIYSGKPGVLFAEPNYINRHVYSEETGNIPETVFSTQSTSTSPDMTGKQYAYGNGAGGMDVPGWNDASNRNADGVVVAVLDTGVDYEHEDLKDVMWDEGEDYEALRALGGGKYGINTGYGYFNGNPPKQKNDPMDIHGHGTHCAGIIAANWNNIGISGAANGVKIMALNDSIDLDGISYNKSDIAAFNYILTAKKAGVNVAAVNCSFGGTVRGRAVYLAVKELGENGIVVCFAAGNYNADNDVISFDNSLYTDITTEITVGGVDKNGNMYRYSDFGKRTVDLFSPAVDVLSTYPGDIKEAIPDKNISHPVKNDSNTDMYDDFSSGDFSQCKFRYSAAGTSQIDIVNEGNKKVLKISGSTVEPDNPYGFRPLFTVSADLPGPADGKKYSLVFSSRIRDEGEWYFVPEMMNEEGEWESLLPFLEDSGRDFTYLVAEMDGERFDLQNLNIRVSLYNDDKEQDKTATVTDAAIGELWITDEQYPYSILSGTSMACPAVVGEVAILAKAYPNDSAEKRAARVLASAKPNNFFTDLSVTGGQANVRNALDENKYTPVINGISAEADGLHIRGYFFEDNNLDVSITQGDNTWTVSENTLNLISCTIDSVGKGDIRLDIPSGMNRGEEVRVRVTDNGKPEAYKRFERILTVYGSEYLPENEGFYRRIPISETGNSLLADTKPYSSFMLNGTLYFLAIDGDDTESITICYKDGLWYRLREPIDAYFSPAVWNRKCVYVEAGNLDTLVYHDGSRVVDRKKFIPEKQGVALPNKLKWALEPPDENDTAINLYYDGKDLILIRSRENNNDRKTAVYRLDPFTGKGSFLGSLQNYYYDGVVLTHEEREGEPNSFYIIGEGVDPYGAEEDFVAEKFTIEPFISEIMNNIEPYDYVFNEESTWSGCGLRDWILLAGPHTVERNGNIHTITADNYSYDYSCPADGVEPIDMRISDTTTFHTTVTAGYGKVYFLCNSREGFVFCYEDADTLPSYGDLEVPDPGKFPYADPASPLHRTTAEDIVTVSGGNAVYHFDPLINTAVIGHTREDISSAFASVSGNNPAAKHRYRSSDKRIASVNKKGIMKAKRRGEVDIEYQEKVKGGSWTTLKKVHFYVQVPEMEKKAEVKADARVINAYSFLSKTTYSPTKWRSTNRHVATVNESGAVVILKKGRTNIIAEYGDGKKSSKKRYKTRLKVGQ